MLIFRKSEDRGETQLNWLDSKHTFSFADYYDPDYMGFGALRVINEDKIKPGGGFGTHHHENMEILTYVMKGELEHKDTLGNGSIIIPGDVQRMSAGTGISHSEFNPQTQSTVHLLQIWILPEKKGLTPSYEQKNFTERRKPGNLTLLASSEGKDGSLKIHQDAYVFVLDLSSKQAFQYLLRKGRMAWMQVARGNINLQGYDLKEGDGLGLILNETALQFQAENMSEILIFDLPYSASYP